jgi:hypothetical protein
MRRVARAVGAAVAVQATPCCLAVRPVARAAVAVQATPCCLAVRPVARAGPAAARVPAARRPRAGGPLREAGAEDGGEQGDGAVAAGRAGCRANVSICTRTCKVL